MSKKHLPNEDGEKLKNYLRESGQPKMYAAVEKRIMKERDWADFLSNASMAVEGVGSPKHFSGYAYRAMLKKVSEDGEGGMRRLQAQHAVDDYVTFLMGSGVSPGFKKEREVLANRKSALIELANSINENVDCDKTKQLMKQWIVSGERWMNDGQSREEIGQLSLQAVHSEYEILKRMICESGQAQMHASGACLANEAFAKVFNDEFKSLLPIYGEKDSYQVFNWFADDGLAQFRAEKYDGLMKDISTIAAGRNGEEKAKDRIELAKSVPDEIPRHCLMTRERYSDLEASWNGQQRVLRPIHEIPRPEAIAYFAKSPEATSVCEEDLATISSKLKTRRQKGFDLEVLKPKRPWEGC